MGLSSKNAYAGGNYMAQKDAATPLTLTISDVRLETIKSDEGSDEKPVVYFQERDSKPMIINKTNFILIDELCGGLDDTDTWIGKRINVYCDQNIMFGGKRVGGLRVRKPTGAVTNGLTWAKAVERAGVLGYTADDLKAALQKLGFKSGTPWPEMVDAADRWLSNMENPGQATEGGGEIPFN